MDKVTYTAGGTIKEYALVKFNGSTADSVVECTSAVAPIGQALAAVASDEAVCVNGLRTGDVIYAIAAHPMSTANAAVYACSGGKIMTAPAVSGTVFQLGYLKSLATAADDIVEVTVQPNTTFTLTV